MDSGLLDSLHFHLAHLMTARCGRKQRHSTTTCSRRLPPVRKCGKGTTSWPPRKEFFGSRDVEHKRNAHEMES